MATPNKIGSLLFCPSCGSLLDVPGDEDVIKCLPCGMVQDASSKCVTSFRSSLIIFSVYDNLTITTRSHPSAFPSALLQKRQLVHTDSSHQDRDRAKEATIQETCPQCGNDEMHFYTMQMRSADEGSTVFYTCPKCNYKFSQYVCLQAGRCRCSYFYTGIIKRLCFHWTKTTSCPAFPCIIVLYTRMFFTKHAESIESHERQHTSPFSCWVCFTSNAVGCTQRPRV